MNPDAQFNLRHLAQFLAVARLGSLARASEEVAISPAALSKRMMELEARIGVRLFERVGRGLALTTEGAEFRREVERLLGHAAEVSERLQERARGASGHVRIGCGPAALHGPVSRMIPRLRSDGTNVSIELASGNTLALLRLLDDHQLDFVVSDFAALQPLRSEHYETRSLPAESFLLAAPLDHPLFRMDTLAFADLLAPPWVTPSVPLPMRAQLSGLLGADAASAWAQRRVHAIPDVQIENMETCMHVAVRIGGVTAALQREAEDGLLPAGLGVLPFQLGIETNLALIHLRHRTPTGVAQRAMDILLEIEEALQPPDALVRHPSPDLARAARQNARPK